ncbi:30 kDa heat shock protein [Madurella mycetomatis]|uniref:30 kDa heat shock protein n=1 Tax=Madurella mycetomatis TaxID=100816 RepID=A0A175WDG0_9PEZI|nr:30 kDa heat shock protein [Madurella mycetomatis]
MSFFPRSFYSSDSSFTPLFRLLDEFDSYTNEARNNQDGPRSRRHQHLRTFNPRFDIRETETAYELHGELPGVDRENINIEFTDPQTIVVCGRVERTYTAGTPPAGLVEGGAQMSGTITEKGEAEMAKNKALAGNGESKGVTKQGDEDGAGEKCKYWVQERSTGEFARTFSFPSRVNQDAVTANLNNGILSLVVPKAKKHEAKRIAIN